MTTFDMSQFHKVFFEEAAEHLASMEALLLELDLSQPDPEQLNAIFRAAHSIKGSAGTFGFSDLAEVTHILENLLDRVRKGQLAMRADMVDAFLAAGDVLGGLLAAHRGDGEADRPAMAAICARLLELSTTDAPPAVVGSDAAASEANVEAADDSFGLFEPLPCATSATETDDGSFGLFAEMPEAVVLESSAVAAKLTPLAVEIHAEAGAGERRAPPRSGNDASIRVGVEKVDQLINLIGELVITQAMLAQSAAELDPARFERLFNGLVQLERNTRDMQESVMSIRMMPISVVFSRFPRVVRDVAQKLDKQVELKLIGETTELDKGLIERISDPLTHLVRNSLDHGIETPQQRIAAGKPACGTITLKAYHQGGNVVIEVADDGAGLNRARILAKARERGLPAGDGLSDQEVWQLIFEAGFSTAEQVTEVSGRGVGMDVVKRNITALGGRVEIDSNSGGGTRMTVRLPLTLAILDGMSIAVGQQIYILPLGSVIESLQATPAMIKSLTGVERLIQVRGEYLPVVALHQAFGIPGAIAQLERGIMVLIEADGRKAALFVDALVGQHQVVIKSLEGNYRKVTGISGATIMGDGRVALILDVAALIGWSGNAILAAA